MALLELRDLGKRYGAVEALHGVSFDVNAGEVVALVGDNGAGKSTTAKIVVGDLRPDAGSITFDGALREWSSPRAARLAGIEMVYQDTGLARHLSVAANIFLGREKRRSGVRGRLGFLDRGAMADASAAALSGLHVNVPRGEYPVSALSGGQRQAIALAKALSFESKLLILDEPANHLGVVGAQEVLRSVRLARDHGVGILLISHTIPHVLEVADRILALWEGQLAGEIGATDATIEKVVALITGSNVGSLAYRS